MAHTQGYDANSVADYIDRQQASGRYTVTRAEVEHATHLDGMIPEAAFRRLRARRRILSPRRGFHVIVPIEYRAAGAPEPFH